MAAMDGVGMDKVGSYSDRRQRRQQRPNLQPPTSNLLLFFLLLLPLLSCDEGDNGVRLLKLTIWGEAFIEEGIPASEFSDDWSITFDRFIVAVHDVSTHGCDTDIVYQQGCTAYDLVVPGPQEIAWLTACTGTFKDTTYAIRPATQSCATATDLPQLATMQANGWSVFVEGTAVRNDDTYTFQWGFPADVTFGHCESQAVLSADNPDETIQLTIHGDHLFYNSLVNPEAPLAFDVIAGVDADGDHHITNTELKSLSGPNFAALDNYDVPDPSIANLYDYLTAQAATLGHIDGEHHCHP